MSVQPIGINVVDLVIDTYDSNLKAPAYSGASTISVYSISNFAINQILVVGNFGEEDAELVKTHASTAPTGTTITLASNLVKDHPGDVKVSVLLYDQLEVSSAATVTGTKTVLATVSVDPEKQETLYNDTATSSGYFFTRYKNSITGLFSDYSDPMPVTGAPSNTVAYMVQIAMSESQKEFTAKLTYQGIVQEINECLRFVRGKLKRWSNDSVYDYITGQANRGVYKFSLPTNYYDPNSNRSMLDVRIGTLQHLIYQDKQEYDDYMYQVNISTLATLANTGDTTLTLTSSADFNKTGTIDFFVSNILVNVSYTSKDDSTGIISGIPATGTGSITQTIPANTNAWQGEFESTPTFFTVNSGNLIIWPIADSTNIQRNVYIDYFTDITEVDSDSDVITLAKFDMIKHWIMWYIRNITERNGKKDMTDGDFVMFNNLLNDAIKRESNGNKFKMKPRVSGMRYNRYVNPSQAYDSYQRN